LGRSLIGGAEIAKRFHILRAVFLASNINKFPKFEDLRDTTPEAFFSAAALPSVIIFVSHRWQTLQHPDPNGLQLNVLKNFLDCIKTLSVVRSGETKDYQASRRILFSHGGFQAAYFLAECNGLAGKPELWKFGSKALEHIGIWYDYSCMPQDSRERINLIDDLKHIHQLIGASTFVALRQPGDEYDRRAWCAAEIAVDADVERTMCRKIVLRLDLMGQPFTEQTLLEGPGHLAGMRKISVQRISTNSQTGVPVSAIAEYMDLCWAESENGRDIPMFVARLKPELFPGQRQFLVSMINILTRLSDLDARGGASVGDDGLQFDVADAVSQVAQAVGLRTSHAADLAYTSLLILYSRHRGAPTFASFYADCLARLLEGKTTVLRHYREDRTPYQEKAWYVFADVPERDVRKPAWVAGA
jgi:hypothetical protein